MQLTDEQFNAIEHLLPTPRGNVKIHNRTVIDACHHMLKEGCTWRSLPERCGNWHTICTRWNRWSKKGVWEKVFKGVQELGVAPSATLVGGLDSTSVKVRKHGAGALEKNGKQAIGRSRGNKFDVTFIPFWYPAQIAIALRDSSVNAAQLH